MKIKPLQYTVAPETRKKLAEKAKELTISQGQVLSRLLYGINDDLEFPEYTTPPRAATYLRKAMNFRLNADAYDILIRLSAQHDRPIARIIDYIVDTHELGVAVVEVTND